jgi:hypothetical protein
LSVRALSPNASLVKLWGPQGCDFDHGWHSGLHRESFANLGKTMEIR